MNIRTVLNMVAAVSFGFLFVRLLMGTYYPDIWFIGFLILLAFWNCLVAAVEESL